MKRLQLLSIVIFLNGFSILNGQQSQPGLNAELLNLFTRLHAAKEDSVRLSINDSVKIVTARFAGDEKLFRTRYPDLKYLGQIVSPDSALKIITWNIVLKNGNGRYYSYIIRKNEEGTPLNVNLLTRDYEQGIIRTDTIYSARNWYGALYYDIRPFSYDETKCWILLGINYSDPFAIRKIIDVLSFSTDGSLVLGKFWFDNGKSLKYRHVLEYSSSAMITLRFMPDSTIVFDHLVPVPGSGINGKLVYGPDYSYDSFKFDSGIWKLLLNVDARNPQKEP